jgi:hypothetical protein
MQAADGGGDDDLLAELLHQGVDGAPAGAVAGQDPVELERR